MGAVFILFTEFVLCHHQASLTVWWIILRFMGDLPEPKNKVQVRGNSRQERLFPQDWMSPDDRHQEMTQNRKSSVTVKDDNDVMMGEGPTLDRPLTTLEKLHIIVGYVILRRDLR